MSDMFNFIQNQPEVKIKTSKLIFFIIGTIAIVLTLIPFLKFDYWWVRMFDFPHLQLTYFSVFAFVLYLFKFNLKSKKDYVFIAILLVCTVYQVQRIFPYTQLSQYEVLNSSNGVESFSILTCNVLQENNKIDLVKNEIRNRDADIILLTETNDQWINSISNYLKPKYGFSSSIALNNTYGMVLFSKLEMFDTKIKYLVSDSVPSIHTKIKLATNDTIQIFAIHPTPPIPHENSMSSDRDTEMMMIAKKALDSKYPVVTLGDFNDVAWSNTSKLFQDISRLLDVRKGRGLYNTYNAKSFIMRWPLDHIFISSEFRLKSVMKCNDVNSDHFPLYTELTYEPDIKKSQERPYPSKTNLKNAEDQIKEFKINDKRKKHERMVQ